MTKLSISMLALLVVLAAPSMVQAEDVVLDVPVDGPISDADTGWYLSVFGGGSWPGFAQFNYDGDPQIQNLTGIGLGWVAGVAAGAQMGEFLRAEIELSHLSESYDGVDGNDYAGRVDSTFLLANLWLQMATGSGFTPYVGGGVGGAYAILHDVDQWFDSDQGPFDGFGLAYQLGGGVVVAVTENVSVDLGYRFKAVSDAFVVNDRPSEGHLSFGSHVVQLGATVDF